MTRKCPMCRRTLELNNRNFRTGGDGFWRNNCRKCENRLRRKRYQVKAKDQPPRVNPYKVAREKRLEVLVEKYDKNINTLTACGLTVRSPSVIADIVLANAELLISKRA